MKWVFWVSAALLFYTFAGYPLLMFFCLRLRKRPVKQANMEPDVSIVIAAHNEAAVIGSKLQNLAQLDYPVELIEIIVASDGSTDSTDEIVRTCDDPRVRLISCERLGKAAALNQAVAAARGEIVCFTDARQMIEPDALRCLLCNFSDAEVGCVSGELMLRESGSANSGVGLYWKIEKFVRQAESDTGSVVGATGALYAVRRELIPELPVGIILDDVFIPIEVVRHGKRVLFDGRARAWDELPSATGNEFRRKVRTLAGNYQLVQMWPWLLTPQNPLWFRVMSHKLLRLGAPALLLFALFSSWLLAGASAIYLSAALVQSALVVIGLLGMYRIWPQSRVFAAITAFYVLNAAAAIACVAFLRNRNKPERIWTTSGQAVQGKARASGAG